MNPNTHDNAFGIWLKGQLDQKLLGRDEFAQRARISRSALFHYLSGKRLPDENAVRLIVKALGVSPDSVPKFERR